VLVAGNGVAHNNLILTGVFDKDETVAAIEQIVMPGLESKVESLGRDAVRRVQDGFEHDPLVAEVE
jgi:sensor domain CHASE-containing protein